MAKPKKQATPKKSTETEEIVTATVDLPETQTKDTAGESTEAVESDSQESNTNVAKDTETPSSTTTEPLNATVVLVDGVDYQQTGLDGAKVEYIDDKVRITAVDGDVREFTEPTTLPIGISVTDSKDEKQTVKNGWDAPLPTKVVTIKKSYLRETAAEVLYVASLGGELDTTLVPTISIPFFCRMLLPESKYQDYLERKDYPEYKEDIAYNTVLAKSFDRFDFYKTLVKLGKDGAFLKPRTEVIGGTKLLAQLLIHNPVAETFSTKLSAKKVKYSAEELESFDIDQLRAIGGWYNIPSKNSKGKYIKEILEVQ